MLRSRIAAAPVPCQVLPGWPAPQQRELANGGICGTAHRAGSWEGFSDLCPVASPRDFRPRPVQSSCFAEEEPEGRRGRSRPLPVTGLGAQVPQLLLTGGGLSGASLLALHTLLPATGAPEGPGMRILALAASGVGVQRSFPRAAGPSQPPEDLPPDPQRCGCPSS